MQYKQLGRTNINVSVVGMGCWALAGGTVWGEQDDKDSIDTVREAIDLGVNFVDTEEGYGAGKSEMVLGKALVGRRQETVVAAKVSPSHLASEELREACERNLRNLGTDYIDLYQIHWPNWNIPIAETVGVLEDLKHQGKIRAFGVSNFGIRDLSDLLDVGRCQTDQLPYSLLFRAVEFEIQRKCLANEIGIICYSPLAQGVLTGKFMSADGVPDGRARSRHFSKDRPLARHREDGCETETFVAIRRIREACATAGLSMAQAALAWTLQQSGVTTVLADARKPLQIRENAEAAEIVLSPDVLRELTAATDEVKALLGPDPDQYDSNSRYR